MCKSALFSSRICEVFQSAAVVGGFSGTVAARVLTENHRYKLAENIYASEDETCITTKCFVRAFRRQQASMK
jgi:hypothetical protein